MAPAHDPRLSTQLGPLQLQSPLILASGILGVSASSLMRVAESGAGAVCSKSCSLDARAGHKGPTIVPLKYGLLNAVGLSNPGAKAFADEIREYKSRSQVPIIASVFGSKVDEFSEVAGILAEAKPDLIELNLSCPNVENEFSAPFAASAEQSATIVRAVKLWCSSIPISVKLIIETASLASVAAACEQAGADMITAINAVGPGMKIDVLARMPVLANKVGGLSGEAILPLAVRAIYDIAGAVSIPIIGVGGVHCTEDALQMMMAGASAVGLGTAIAKNGIEVFDEIERGLIEYCENNKLAALNEIVGVARTTNGFTSS